MMVITRLKETVIGNILFQEYIDGRNFYDQTISDQIKKYDEIREIATGKVDD